MDRRCGVADLLDVAQVVRIEELGAELCRGERRFAAEHLRDSRRRFALPVQSGHQIAAAHVDVTRRELADFVLGKGVPAKAGKAGGPLAELDRVLDRSRLLPPPTSAPEVLDAKGDLEYNDGLEH